jgi:hypothetical protein
MSYELWAMSFELSTLSPIRYLKQLDPGYPV